MINTKALLPATIGLSMLFAACGGETKTETTTTDSTATTVQAPQIVMVDIPASPDYPDAKLAIGNVTATKQGEDSVKVSFAFNVKGYELKSQTADASSKLCNNSDKGQHIHFILDNKPYVALYEPKHEVVLAKNTEHNLLVFLSRSYHESVKTQGAAAIYHFKIDENGKLQKLEEPKTPMVFYSRPKGDYLGKDTENLLFDFYVWNANLGANDYKVKAVVKTDGGETPFDITEWKPKFINGMPMGKSSITLTLVDKDGKKVDGPETEVTREFNLAQDEPMPAK
jgi:hypothetical protein